MTGAEFSREVFHAPDRRCRDFTSAVLRHADPARIREVLDIGCGTGEQIFDLATAFPGARFTGLDISPGNVELAKSRATDLGLGQRVRFLLGDYMDMDVGSFDLVVSCSTLQLIEAPTSALFGKMAGELTAEGRIICTLPDGCVFNHALWAVRRLFRAARCPLTDALVLALGGLLHRGEYDREMLRQRLPYMYITARCHDGPAFRRQLEGEAGLVLHAEEPVAHASIGQARHKLLVFRKARPRGDASAGENRGES